MTTNRNFTRDPDAELDYGVDWSDWLQDGETISSSEWAVDSGEGLTLDNAAHDDTMTTIWTLPGATVGVTYHLRNRIVTSEGRTDDRTLLIRIVEQ